MKLDEWVKRALLLPILDGRDSSPVLADARFVILDIDVTGIDARKDRATGIATLPVDAGRFRLGDMEYCSLVPEDDGSEWQNTVNGKQYRVLVDSLTSALIVTYNPRFVRHMIKRAAATNGFPLPYGKWIDLAAILSGAIGNEMGTVVSMQGWQERMSVPLVKGHSAIEDVFAMAQLLEMALAYCDDYGIRTLNVLNKAQKSRAWLHGE